MKRFASFLALFVLVSTIGLQSAYAGFASEPIGTIYGFKFSDMNANGIWDQPDESPVPDTEICLFDENSIFGEAVTFEESFLIPSAFAGFGFEPIPIECVLTDSSGFYQFNNVLFPGFYYVTETLAPGQIQTFPDSEDCYVFGEVPSFEIFGSSAHCVELFDVPDRTDVNFGNTLGASLHGQKTNNLGEPIPFVQIQACAIDPLDQECRFNEQIFYTETMDDDLQTPEDETGHYWLTVPPGDYRIEEFSFGTSQIFPANGAPHFVTVSSGDVIENLDFVNENVPPGTIEGSKFQDANGDGIKDGDESGVSGVTFCLYPTGTCTQTNFNGDFTFFNVPAGQYSLNEVLPSGSVNTTPLIVDVDVLSAQTTTVPPFGNTSPVPPNPEVSVGPLNTWNSGGLPSVYWQNNITVSKDTSSGFDHCGTDSPNAVTLQLRFTETDEIIPIILEQDATNPDVFSTVPALEPFFPRHGVLNLDFDVFCPDGTVEFQKGGSVYIDPSGQITDVCTDDPIEGAAVTLYKEFPPTTGNFVVASPSDYIQTTGSTQITGADGRYGWDTVPGNYFVSASAPGFVTQDSIVVPIPPPELELDLALERVGGCDIVPPVITIPADVTVELGEDTSPASTGTATATDDVDPAPVISFTDVESLDSEGLGTITRTWTATDSSGNSASEDQIITIVDTSSQSLKQQKADQIPILEEIVDDANKKATKELEKAIKFINKSLSDKYWEDENSLTEKHGHKVFDEEKHAVKSLLKAAKSDPSIDVSGVIDTLVEIDRQLAQDAIDAAGEFAGDKKVDKAIAKSNKAMDKAQEELDKGKPDKAIDEYKEAWHRIVKEVGKKM